jgi:hypothetical protein
MLLNCTYALTKHVAYPDFTVRIMNTMYPKLFLDCNRVTELTSDLFLINASLPLAEMRRDIDNDQNVRSLCNGNIV